MDERLHNVKVETNSAGNYDYIPQRWREMLRIDTGASDVEIANILSRCGEILGEDMALQFAQDVALEVVNREGLSPDAALKKLANTAAPLAHILENSGRIIGKFSEQLAGIEPPRSSLALSNALRNVR